MFGRATVAASTNPWMRTTGDHRDFWLVQRMRLREAPQPNATGIDRVFALEYMGSAEYEWDTPKLSLALIRSARKLVIHEEIVTRAGRTRPVYFVGPAKTMAVTVASFTAWFAGDHVGGSDRYLREKEASWFDLRFAGDDGDYHASVVGWWAFRAPVMFSLDRGVAERMLLELRPPKK